MKKTIALIMVIVAVSAAGLMILVAHKSDRTGDVPGYGYHGVEESDIFETGHMEGELSLAPMNPEFMTFDEYPDDPKPLRKTLHTETGRGLGLIPSPLPPEVHKRSLARSGGGTDFPSSYDMRDPDGNGDRTDGVLPPVRDQGECGACWAFATYGSVESILSREYGVVADFSENNVINRSGYDWGECIGGNIDMSMAYHARNTGPVYEGDDPFYQNTTGYCDDCSPVRYIDSMIKLPVRSGVDDINYVKAMIMTYGPLYASMYWTETAYDPAGYSYYYQGFRTNHAVTVIGWDDDYKVSGAPGNGAFIVRNSWGADWGEAGYFYISYYDRSFAFSSLVAFDDKPDALLSFDRIYYYDHLGMTSSIGYGKDPAWGANRFTPQSDGTIVAVGLFTTHFDTTYEIRIYDDYTGTGFEGLRGGPYKGSLTGRGYHTVRLDVGVPITHGDDFSIVIKFYTPGYSWPVPLEKPFPGYSSKAAASYGESYLSKDGVTWDDATTLFPNTNVCIKALVRENECEPETISVEGPGSDSVFVVDAGEDAYVRAVVTDGCGTPVQDAEVVAELGNGENLSLFDDGRHNDFSSNDGIYGNELPSAKTVMGKGLIVSASKDGAGNSTVSKMAEPDSGSSGCFISSLN